MMHHDDDGDDDDDADDDGDDEMHDNDRPGGQVRGQVVLSRHFYFQVISHFR